MSAPFSNSRPGTRIEFLRTTQHRIGADRCIYPIYGYAHPLSDAFENITHSVCTLEFADHRPLYDWVLDALPLEAYPRKVEGRPQQIEFARLNLSYTVMSKRKLRELVEDGYVEGWADPR